MLGTLPTTLNVSGTNYQINPDYRNVLQIFSAYNDDALQDNEKAYICLKRLYLRFESIPREHYLEAYKQAVQFIEAGETGGRKDKPSPKIVDWDHDEQMIFAAVNKVAGVEVRSLDFMHWWTFLGYFQNVDRDDIWGFILTIRQKRAKGRQLEKYEKEFFNANPTLCDPKLTDRKKDNDKYLADLFNELSKGGS